MQTDSGESNHGFVPYDRIEEDAWRRLVRGADRRGDPMHLLVLATLDRAERPDARLMVLRGASRELSGLWFHTDGRARKARQIEVNRDACVVGYDPGDRVQLRIFGRCSIHRDDEIADRHWEQIDLAVCRTYGMPLPPGEPLPSPDPRVDAHHRRIEAGEEMVGRENFAVIQLAVDAIEWLQVGDNIDYRALMRATDGWRPVPLCP
jgi:hypothetical protein